MSARATAIVLAYLDAWEGAVTLTDGQRAHLVSLIANELRAVEKAAWRAAAEVAARAIEGEMP